MLTKSLVIGFYYPGIKNIAQTQFQFLTGKAARAGKLFINVLDCWKYLLIFMVFVKSMLIQSCFIHKEIC